MNVFLSSQEFSVWTTTAPSGRALPPPSAGFPRLGPESLRMHLQDFWSISEQHSDYMLIA